VQRERLVAREDVEARRARAVTDRHARGDRRGRRGDLGIRHAQKHGVDADGVGAAAERAVGRQSRRPQRARERVPEAAGADDRARRHPADFGGGRGQGSGDPVQFSHEIPAGRGR
jgi:hypothetical protein